MIVDSALTGVPFPARPLELGRRRRRSGRSPLVLALMAFGFYASRAGQPLFGKFSDEV